MRTIRPHAPTRLLRLALPLVALWALPAPAEAQIVDVQRRFAGERKDGWQGAAEASVDWRTGNTERVATAGTLGGSFQSGDHLVLGLVRGEYEEVFGTVSLARTMEHLRYRHALGGGLRLEAFVQHEYDRFRRLQVRALGGAGPRLEYRTEGAGLAVGVAAMVEYEKLLDAPTADSGETSTVVRASSYLIGDVTLMKGISLSETTYFQPRVDQPSDVRVLSETALVAKANERVSMSIGFVLALDTAPPEEVEPLDTQVRSALAVSF